MKRLGLLSIIACSVSGIAIAAGVDCNTIPTCAELGFIKTTTDCEGKAMLRCPFDVANDSAVYCTDGKLCGDEFNLETCPENGSCEECGGKQKFNGCNEGYEENNGACVENGICKTVGDILYNDLKCYSTPPSDKTAIAVVFDTTNKLAIGLTEASSTMYWWSSYEDIPDLENCTDSNTVITTCGIDGKANSAALVAAGYTNASYAAGYCYNQTTGELAKGDWFLPSIKEIYSFTDNLSILNTAITNADGTPIASSFTPLYWTSTVYSSDQAWILNIIKGLILNRDKNDMKYSTRCAIAY